VAPASAQTAAPPLASTADASRIVAVVNGDAITKSRCGQPAAAVRAVNRMSAASDVLNRLTPQVTRQLIDERLRLQEVQRRT